MPAGGGDAGDAAVGHPAAPRLVVIGSHSTVWAALRRQPALAGRNAVAIGHAQLPGFEFRREDTVWLLSHSGRAQENSAMLARLRQADVAQVVYLSSSSTIVSRVTRCYGYPRLKLRAETEALAMPNGRVLTVGMMVEDEAELPGGTNAATTYAALAAFMARPEWGSGQDRRRSLVRLIERPYRSEWERRAHGLYGRLMSWAGPFPCILRPLDVLLRWAGIRWYGYVHLSNRLWNSTTS